MPARRPSPGRSRPSRLVPSSPRLLAALLGGSGVLHLVAPKPYDALVPRRLPGRARWYTTISGVAELACAAALLTPRTRRAGGLASAALLVAVFPANVSMAWDWRRRPLPLRALAVARLPLQAPLVAWALRARG